MWGPMGCRDRWTAAEHVPGTARPQCFSRKEEAGRYQVDVSGLTSAARAVAAELALLAGTCGRGGSCGMLVAKQPAEVELSGYQSLHRCPSAPALPASSPGSTVGGPATLLAAPHCPGAEGDPRVSVGTAEP